MKFLSFLFIFNNIMVLKISHPVLMMVMILFQTFLICIILWTIIKSSWLSFILFIIFLGGLMVLFVYISSLASNEKFEMSMKFIIVNMSLTVMAIIFLASYFPPLPFTSNMNLTSMVSLILSSLNVNFTTLIMSYLLFVLIVVVKITKMTEGPLRSVSL